MSDKTTQIKAVLNKDLENLLVKTGQINDFLGGYIKCMYCGDVINYDNLSIIIPSVQEGNIALHFCCNNPECLSKYRIENGNE